MAVGGGKNNYILTRLRLLCTQFDVRKQEQMQGRVGLGRRKIHLFSLSFLPFSVFACDSPQLLNGSDRLATAANLPCQPAATAHCVTK
jgi:hypothetical protein